MLSLSDLNRLEAQQVDSSRTNNYVVLTQKISQLEPIILTAETLKMEEGKNFGDFQITICGKGVEDHTDSEKISVYVENANKTGVSVIACGFSLTKFKVDRSQVPREITIVENGIHYNFQLQKKGYKSLGH